MNKGKIEEELVQHVQYVQYVLDLIRGDERLSDWTVLSLNLLCANFTECVKQITAPSQTLPPKQVRDTYMLLTTVIVI